MVDFIGKNKCPYCGTEMILESPLLNKLICPKCGYRCDIYGEFHYF